MIPARDQPTLTHETEPRGYRMCRCFTCGHESVCQPNNDYYTKRADPLPKPLYCERCIVPPGAIEFDLRKKLD